MFRLVSYGILNVTWNIQKCKDMKYTEIMKWFFVNKHASVVVCDGKTKFVPVIIAMFAKSTQINKLGVSVE